MIRKAFVMSVFPGKEEEYEKRHSPIWPELETVLRQHGVRTYSIFLHPETNQLFGLAEVESEERWSEIASTPICRKWWSYMKDLMPTQVDDSPQSIPLREVFRIS